MLLANPTQTFQVLQTCVLDHAVPVKAEATALLCSFVDSIPNKEAPAFEAGECHCARAGSPSSP